MRYIPRRLTKFQLIWTCTQRLPLYFGIGFFLFFFVIGLFFRTFLESLSIAAFGAILLGGGYFLFSFFACLRGLLLLRRQEKEMNFRFSQAIGDRTLNRELQLADDEWFISCSGELCVFRKGFLRQVCHVKTIPRSRYTDYYMELEDHQGRRFTIRTTNANTSKRLKAWLRRNPQ